MRELSQRSAHMEWWCVAALILTCSTNWLPRLIANWRRPRHKAWWATSLALELHCPKKNQQSCRVWRGSAHVGNRGGFRASEQKAVSEHEAWDQTLVEWGRRSIITLRCST